MICCLNQCAVQSGEDEFHAILELSDEQIGRLVRSTWLPGQYVKYKRYLLQKMHTIQNFDVNALDRAAQIALLEQLEQAVGRHAPEGPYEVQSGEVVETPNLNGGASVTEVQTVKFVETTQGSHQGMVSRDNYGAYDKTPGVELGEFLSRPTRVLTGSWDETGPAGNYITWNPWYTFFNDTRIKKKLDNYSWIRCNLHVKFIITASPFYYGAMLVSYRPLLDVNTDTVVTTSSNAEWVPRSQRPHIWLYPQENKAGTLRLPFFYHKNWLDIKSATDLQNMGEISMDIVSILRSANAAVGVGVTVQAFAWATDVELCGPTVGLAVQSGDEYGDGPISKPAQAVAALAGQLSDVPVIGKFATATQIGAKAAGQIAGLFGFTNVPVISDTEPVRPSAFPQLSSAEIGYPFEKLTLDPKNELSIDPSIVGMTNEDELNIAYLAQKESLLTTTTWSTSDAVDQQLFYSAVTPWIFRDDATANQHVVNMPPISWLANLFENWRGDVIFRFKFVVSKYHKGRVRISFDPSGQGANNLIQVVETSNAIYTRVVDISEEDSVEFRVPYKQAVAWLRTDTSFTNVAWANRATDTNPNYVYNPADHNGMITVRVMNVLTAPVASSTINMIVSVRGAPNLEFANPTYIGEFSPYTIQSGEEYEDEGTLEVGGPLSIPFDGMYLTNFGECTKSLRQLLRRSSLNEVWAEPNDTTSTYYVVRHTMTRFPVPYGFDSNGITSANKVLAGGTANFNFTFSTPLNWVMPAFVATRGSMNWTFNTNLPSSNGPVATHVRVVRRPNVTANATRTFANLVTKGTNSANANFFRNNFNAGQAGQALTHQGTNAGLSVALPNYNRFKFNSTSPSRITAPTATDGGDHDTHLLEVYTSPLYGATTRPLVIEKYVGIGTDFTLHWFLNVPTSYFYISSITPA